MRQPFSGVAAALALVVWPAAEAGADGGVVVARGRVASLDCTVLVAPAPLRAGLSEWSVLLQRAADAGVVLDAEVEIELRRTESGAAHAHRLVASATRQASANRLFYTALLHLPEAGGWHGSVRVRSAEGEGALVVEVGVAPGVGPLREHWRALGLPPLALGLFGLHQWLVLGRTAPRAGRSAFRRQRR
jgi:hypothetical protein